MSRSPAPVDALFDRPGVEWWRYVPCAKCNAPRQSPCQSVEGPARRPHVSRVRVGDVLHGTLWLLTNGYACDVICAPDHAGEAS